MRFKNKTVAITGASRGIGLAIAHAFAREGASIGLCSTQHKAATSLADDLHTTYGIPTYGKGVNVASFDEATAFIGDVCDALGPIHILINNAGITRDNLLLRLSEEDWTSVIDINLKSVFNATKAAIRPMLKQKFGRIITITSVVGLMGNPGQSNYAASKAGIIGFTKSIAKEYGKKNITVNAIAPGFIQTDMTDSLPNDYLDTIITNVPMSRIGTPSDVSNACMFLASDEASYITGQVLSVDGGLYM
jgi:3-oxoacyl-[acyl-carrier protein] reductase